MLIRKSCVSDPQLLWAAAYVLANALALLYIFDQGGLIGDLIGFPIGNPMDLLFTFGLVAASVALLLLLFNMLARVRGARPPVPYNKTKMGVVVAIAQIAFIAYVRQTGLFVAGSAERAGSVASAFWVIFNVDALFFVYYATCRDARLFKLNLVLWIVSFIQRGWFGYIFFVVAFESFRLIRSRKLTLRHLLLLLSLLFVYPILDLAKIYIRVSDVIEPSQAVEFVTDAVRSGNLDWTNSLLDSSEKIVARMQLVSHAQAIRNNINEFHREVEAGELGAFWKEGIVGIVWDRLIGMNHAPEAAQALAMFIAPTLDSSWNVNPSLVGWLMIYDESFPMTLLYVVMLCSLSIVFMSRVSRSRFSQDVLWFVWLTFLIPGWIAQFVSFLVAMAIYVFLAACMKQRPARAIVRAPVIEVAPNSVKLV